MGLSASQQGDESRLLSQSSVPQSPRSSISGLINPCRKDRNDIKKKKKGNPEPGRFNGRMVQLKFAADVTPRRRRRTFSVVRLQRLIPSSCLHRPEDGHGEASRRGFRGSREMASSFSSPSKHIL